MSTLESNNYWIQFFKEYYKALLGVLVLIVGFYMMYSFSADDKLYRQAYIIAYIVLAIYFVIRSLKEIFMLNLENKRLRSLLKKNGIDTEDAEAIVFYNK